MSGKFNMADYVDVAERIRIFIEKYPEGSLQSEVTFVESPLGVLCRARAYRTPGDIQPGVGHAFEPIPGKTSYTRDSEVMNAETSAWGRAIVALGFETKKIASADEVRNRSGAGPEPPQSPQTPDGQNGESPEAQSVDSAAASPPAPETFKAPAGPRGGKVDAIETKALADELRSLVKTLHADDSLPAIAEKEEAGDAAWLKRQIATAKERIKTNVESAPFV